MKKLTQEDFIKRANKVHNNFYSYNNFIYNGYEIKSFITCPIHGDFLQNPHHHLAKIGCPKCLAERMSKLFCKTTEQFIKEAIKVHGDKYIYTNTKYINCDTKIEILCKKHGSFWQDPGHHLKGCGCPTCKSSKGEIKVENYLIEKNIKFEKQKKFNDFKLYSFDFYLPELNTCIEYDGIQHFEPRKKFGGEEEFKKTKVRDKTKTQYCLKKHIRIIRIKYTENINNILDLYF